MSPDDGAPAGDGLVVRTRVRVTKSNLERISRLQATIARRENGVRELLSKPAQLRRQMNDVVWSMFAELEKVDRELDNGAVSGAVTALDDALRAQRTLLTEACAQAEALGAELFEPLSERQDVLDFLVRQAKDMGDRLSTDNYWKQRATCELLFAEYVDVLQGIALRSARFGEGDHAIGDFFRIADQLPKVWGELQGYRWESLALPAALEQTSSTKAGLLHIGFPEWTIWALPLLQREFGHIYVERMAIVPPGDAESRPVLSSLVADALASLVTGPAYACATLLLRLDPGAPDTTDVALRAATILQTLSAVDAPGQVQILARRLEDEWRSALVAAGGSETAFDDALDSEECERAVELAVAARPVGGADGGAPETEWGRRWATIDIWAQQLTQDAPAIDLAAEDEGDSARPWSLVLIANAAWLARVRPDPKDDADQDTVTRVEEAAVARLLEHIRPSAPGPSAPTANTRLR